jgi:undecaprenyl diphosphate synthase
MDGNGRWAKYRGLPRYEGHRRGAAVVKKVLRAAERVGIKYVTLYALSSENLSRPRAEVDFLMDLCEKFLRRHGGNFIKRMVRFRVIGDPSQLSESLRTTIWQLERDTAEFDRFNVTVALNYGARGEIVHAIKALFHGADADIGALTWDVLRKYLYTSNLPDPDFIIRTSGEQRLSNFLLLQAAYAEFFFTKTLWPDFGEVKFLEAVDDYRHREKRIGNIDGKACI